jgi:hypothetical protein
MTIRPRAWLVAWARLALAPAMAGAAHLEDQPKKHKVVYHLCGAGAEEAKFGPALKTFVTASMDPMKRFTLTLQHVYIRP